MNEHDHAIVIGIRRYADAEDPSHWITNLNGPDNDAKAIADWLRRPDGGGLPHDNVRLIRSADAQDPDEPRQTTIAEALDELADLPGGAYQGYAGRRLYVYASGHGLARDVGEAALLTAEARKATPFSVIVPTWLKWCYKAGRFMEFVLWFDGCAPRAALEHFKACEKQPKFHPDLDKGRQFEAYAAGLGKNAVEAEMPDGTWHGAFTYALLEGLDGAAGAEVTTTNLRKYLVNAMRAYMRDDQRVPAVAEEPSFGVTDDLTFASYPAPKRYPVALVFPPQCVGKAARIAATAAEPAIAETVLDGEEWSLELATGLYAADVPDAGLVQPFEVVGGADDRIVLR